MTTLHAQFLAAQSAVRAANAQRGGFDVVSSAHLAAADTLAAWCDANGVDQEEKNRLFNIVLMGRGDDADFAEEDLDM